MNKIKKLLGILLIVSVLSSAPIQAHAGVFDKVKDAVSKVVDDVADIAGIGYAVPTFGLSLIPGLLDGDILGQDLFGSDDPKVQAQANECLNKSVEQLRSEIKQKYANFRSHPTATAIDNEVSKEKLCAELLNAEDEIQSPSESFLWKPISESDSKAVTLLPTSLRGLVVRTDVFEKETGKKLDSGRFSGDEHNGMRPHYRFPKPGASYGGPIQVIAAVAEGIWIWDIKDAAKRTEGIKGKFSTWAEVAAWEAAQKAKEDLKKLGDLDDLFAKDGFCPAFTEANGPKNLRIMLMGDSNTAGTGNPAGTTAPNSIGYRKVLKEKLTAQGFTVDFVGSQCSGSSLLSDCEHEGYPGKGIAQLQSRVNAGALEQYKPNVVVVLVGSNDMWVSLDNRSPISNTQADAKVNELYELVKDIHKKAPSALILLAKPATPSNATAPLNIYRAGIDDMASGSNFIEVVDFGGFSNDGVHYRPAGFDQIANTLSNKISEVANACKEVLNVVEKLFTKDELGNSGTNDELSVTCRISDTTVEVDEDVTISADIDGGKSPYKIKWSGETSQIDDFDKTEESQTVSFEKTGDYTLKVKVTDDDGETASDSCDIEIVEEDVDDVIVTVTPPAQQVTNNASLASAFYRDLTVGASGSDVTALQQYLVSRGYLVMPAGASYGYFGELTRSALARFQSANGITPAAGYFGQKTRSYIATGFVGVAAPFTPQTYTAPIAQTPSVPATQPTTSSCVDITSTVYYGEEGENVTRVQQYLVSAGHLSMPAGSSYGYYGKATVTALSKFMTTRGYVHNGAIMDAKVLGELKAASCR